MLALLRIITTAALIYCVNQARLSGQNNSIAGDLNNAFWLGGGVLVALVCAASWAPLIGERVADPLSGGLVNSPFVEPKNRLMKLIRWSDKKGYRRLVVLLCFIEGVRAPWLPAGFAIGMRAAKEGSWFQKIYAREVFRFNNAENVIAAYRILRQHGIDPRPHANTDINLVLLSEEQVAKAPPEKLKVKETRPILNVQRDKRIKIGGGE
ncbi:MAG: hypothetical protein ACO1QB_03220 [Verrucomicrobiales bacterium]